MTDETGYGVLTGAQWAELAPLIEQCRPPHKMEHKNLRRTIEAIIWRHENGAKWRSIPPHLGPWWMAAQTFIRWSRNGTPLPRAMTRPSAPSWACSAWLQQWIGAVVLGYLRVDDCHSVFGGIKP